MRKITIYFILFFLIFQNSLLAYSSDPKSFVDELVKDAISKLSDKNLTNEQKAAFVEKVALDNVDINALGLYTLGELRKSSSQEDILRYQKTFEKYFLKSLTSRLTDYSSSEFKILGADKKSAKNPEKPLIRDLIVEGLSLARTQKEEFSSILSSNNNDINQLINKLDEFVNKK